MVLSYRNMYDKRAVKSCGINNFRDLNFIKNFLLNFDENKKQYLLHSSF